MKTYDLDPDRELSARLCVHDHPNTLNWQMRLRLPEERRYRKKSAGTADLDKAKATAWRWYYELQANQKVGIQLDGASFAEVAEAWLEDLKQEVALGNRGNGAYHDYEPVVRRYLVPFFGDKQIDTITEKHIAEYRRWRDSYWLSGPGSRQRYIVYKRGKLTVKRRVKKVKPSPRRIKIEDVPLKQIFEFGRVRGWIRLERMPVIKSVKAKRRNREAFTRDQMAKLLTESIEHWMRGHSMQIRYYRGLMALYIKFIYFTGVRPGEETADIQWRDLTVETDFEGTEQRIVRINARKEGKSEASKRSVVPRKILWPFLDQWRRGTAFNKSEDYIFCHEEGTPIKSFVGSFRTLLNELRKRDQDLWEGAYSLYCIRHSYATHMLQRGKADAWQIARNMGHTDIEMIRTHYGQDKPIDHGGDLSD